MLKKYANNVHGLTLVVVAGAWLMGIFIGPFLQLQSPISVATIGILFICIVLFWHNKTSRLLIGVLLCMMLGVARYNSVSPAEDQQAISRYIGYSLVVRGSVSNEPKLGTNSRLLSIDVNSISLNKGSTWLNADGQMTIQVRGTGFEDPYGANYGNGVQITGKLLSPLPHSLPGIMASMFFPRVSVRGMVGNPIIAALYHWRLMLANTIEQVLPQPQAALLIAILLSLHTPSLKAYIQVFNNTGTAHLIAASGFKVTVLAGIVHNSTTWFYREESISGKLNRRRWRRWLTTVLVIASIAVYTILSGAGPAAIRAGIMGTMIVIAPRIGRRYNIHTALAGTALLMSAIDPFALWDVGFQLSFLGTIGIVMLTPFFQHLLHPIERRLPFSHYPIELCAVTLAAQTATLPILALNFQEISFVAPLTNVLTVPLLGILIILGVLLCSVSSLYMPLALLIGWIARLLLMYLDASITWCNNLPGAYRSIDTLDSNLIWTYYALLIPIVIFATRRFSPTQQKIAPTLSKRTRKILQIGIALLMVSGTGVVALFSQFNSQSTTITFLHVGPGPAQGEAILIRTSDYKTVLIDGGLDVASLAQELDSRLPPWQRSLDAVLLTTPRPDHLRGLLDIVQRYEIGEVIDGGMLHPTTTYALWRRTISERSLHYRAVNQGTTISIGMFVSLQILWPGFPLHKGSDEIRDNGLIIRISAPGLHLLLLGAGAQSRYALAGLLNATDPLYLQANIVQMVEEASTPFPTELNTVLQKSNPDWLLLTPGIQQKKRRAVEQTIDPISTLIKDGRWSNSQIVQTATIGAIDVSNSPSGWNVNIV